MYRCSQKIITIIIMLLCVNVALFASNLENNIDSNIEDEYIFQALDALDNNDFQRALDIYSNLYASTHKLEYLKEMINLSTHLGNNKDVITYITEYEKTNPNDVNIKRTLAHSYMTINQIDDAIRVYKNIIKLEDNKINNKALANLYFFKKDFSESRKHLINAHKQEPDESTLILIVSIDIMNDNFDLSIPLIKKYFPSSTSDEFSQIISELAFNNKILPEIESLYIDYYDKNPNDVNAKNLARVYILLNEPQQALELVKKYNLGDNLMIDLYIMQKDYKNARIMANEAFNKTKDSTYLGILAIIDFEEASDKQSILPRVIQNFKKSLSKKQNHVFYNYLGYLLIDFDINVDEGIQYVKEALELDPNNVAYIDSLAWGLYKKNDCQNAKKIINTIPSSIIKKEDEIKEHLEMIDRCLKK